MEISIQQIVNNLVKNILEKAYSGGINDVDSLASDILNDCKHAATATIEAICTDMNRQMREDKAGRKERGLVLKEKERPRELLTELGRLDLARDYYYDKRNARYVSLLDEAIGIRPYERIGDELSAKMVGLATEISYAKSAEIAGGGLVSRQAVKNQIQKIDTLEMVPKTETKKEVTELHIYADEDHVHMQKPGKQKGKSSKIVPLITVTEGISKEGLGRNRTIGTMYFVDEKFDTKNLWKSTEGYLAQTYDLRKVEKIFVHGDGAKWIQKGLENFPQAVHVMDGYHLEKRLRGIATKFPGRNVAFRLTKAIKSKGRKRADEILHGLYGVAENERERKSITDFGTYLMGNWERIVNRKTLNIPGSCTEAQVSHVLSQRFSRDPLGWSKEGLGKLTKLRVYIKNGGEIEASDFKRKQDDTYNEYADEILKEAISGATDWTIFDGEPFVFDRASGTQTLLHGIGTTKNILWS